jgi:3-oxosteroid 1-dehydrogenase
MELIVTDQWDVIVVGSGAGGLTAALRAADHGLKVLVLEKTGLYGGTSATSGGAIWVPCHGQGGYQDNPECAAMYLKHLTKAEGDGSRIAAFLDHAPAMIAYLHETGLAFDMLDGYPDYYPEVPGATVGRALVPREIDGQELGDDYLLMRRPFGAFMLFNRYSLDLAQAFLFSGRLPGWRRTAASMFLRYWFDLPWRLKTGRDRRATMGNALIGSLRRELKRRDVPIVLNAPLRRVIFDEGRVCGVEIDLVNGSRRFSVRKGLILASGGFEQCQSLRDANLPVATDCDWSLTPPGMNTGDALLAAQQIGATVAQMPYFWWAPSTQLPSRSNPGVLETHQMFFDHRHPHSLIVNRVGERFANESCTYDDFGKAMIADQQRTGANLPCWMIFDSNYRRKYSCGGLPPSLVMPDRRVPKPWWDRYLYRAETVRSLAAKIGIPPPALESSVRVINASAANGLDPQFGRGESAYDRFFGDQSVEPNPALGPVDKPPFYAIRIHLGDLGTKGGLRADAHARVLDTEGRPIAGLYAVGNCAASPFANCYPGSGGTIAAAMTFGYIAADHLSADSDERIS